MSIRNADRLADRFKALSEPTRLRILNALRHGELSVGEIVGKLHMRNANASKHLHQLKQAGFVKRRKDGLHVYYRIADRKVFHLCDLMCR